MWWGWPLRSLPRGVALLTAATHIGHGGGWTVDDSIDAGIGQDGALTVVFSPHQNNFAMRLDVQLWAAPPPDDITAWQEAFEATLDVGERGLIYSNVHDARQEIPVPPGRYLARITGRGFVAVGWPGSTEPGDQWRIQLFPTPELLPPRRLAAWDRRPA